MFALPVVFALGLTLALLTLPRLAFAAGEGGAPEDLSGVGITEHVGDRLPLDAELVDSNGTAVRLKDLFGRGRPVILTLNYSSCVMFCSLQLNGLIDALKRIDLDAPRDFELITVSIDPSELPVRAAATKERYLKQLGRPDVARGWTFLVGKEEQIRAIAASVGFGYKWIEAEQQFAHAAGAILVAPDGRIVRYLHGIQHDPRTLQLGLVEAGEGRVGGVGDRLALFCLEYDAVTGRYALAVGNVVGLSATVMVIGVALLLGALSLRARRHAHQGAGRLV
ncbi:MAG: SCO family protein [Deltaproteobacteria bacterium]|nr:SCO family protein [Deltaproteobacteria bacterium]